MERDIEMEPKMEMKGSNGSIVPPRLEDAGLEDCALSVEGIREAFLRAAEAVKSKAATIFNEEEDGGECIEGLKPSNGEWTDSLVDNSHIPDNPDEIDSCVDSHAGGLLEEAKDRLINIGDKSTEDRVVDAETSQLHLGEERACVEGLQGLPIPKSGSGAAEDEDDDQEEVPTVIETYI